MLLLERTFVRHGDLGNEDRETWIFEWKMAPARWASDATVIATRRTAGVPNSGLRRSKGLSS
jgi:hypothetical protein